MEITEPLVQLAAILFSIFSTLIPVYIFFNFEEIVDHIMKKLKGFTLVELMITIAIIGIIASVVLPTLKNVADIPNTVPTQTAKEKFNEHVDDGCVAKYGAHACTFDEG